VRFTHVLLFFAFAALSLALFYPALQGEFIMDDWGYITQNGWVTGASSPWRFWTTFNQSDYWPLTYTFYWAFFKIFGEHSLGYHLVNVLLHALNGVLIFVLARDFKIRWPLWAALIFLVHPLHVQSVAWIVQFKTLLATALALATLLAFAREKITLALGFFALAVLAKTSVIFLPVVLLGMNRDYRKLAPFFALSLAGGLITIHVNDLNFIDRSADIFHTNAAERALVMVQNLIFYPKAFFWPLNLSYMYPLRVPELYGASLWLVPAGILCLALIAAAVFYKPWREYRFFILSYLVLLFPCLGLVAIPNMKLSLVADHWAYLPDVFMVLFIGKLVRIPDTNRWRAALMVPAAVLAVLAFRHAATFASEEAFWTRAREVNPHHAAPYYNLGVVYGKQEKTGASIDQYKSAIQRDRTHDRAWYNLGRAYFIDRDLEKAEECFLQAVKINPNLVSGYLALAAVYDKAGSREQARRALEKGLAANPGDPELTGRLEAIKN
jgi:tetratricopeptide (TPR) repeat protein